MENLKVTLEDIVEELEVGLSTVELPIHLQKEFTSSIIDFPNKNSSDALSSGGAYNYIPYQLQINKVSENLFKFNFLSRSGDIVGNGVNFQFSKLTEEATPQKLEVVKLNNNTYKLNLRNFKGEIIGATQYIKLPEVVDTIEKGNLNAITSNKVYDLKETLINNLQGINTYLLEVKNSIPTKVGQLENDSNFMSNLEVISLIQEELSKLNSSDFGDIQEIITSINSNIQDINSRISSLVSENTKTNSRIDKNINTIQELSSKIDKLNPDLNGLQIPTKVSELENDSEFVTESLVGEALQELSYDIMNTVVTEYVSKFELKEMNLISEESLGGKGYVTSEDVNNAISQKGFVTAEQVSTALNETTTAFDQILNTKFVSNTQLEQKGYLTINEVNNAINQKGFVTETALSNKGFLTNKDIEELATKQYVNNVVGNINKVLDQINGEDV